MALPPLSPAADPSQRRFPVVRVIVGLWDRRLTLSIGIQFANHNISRMTDDRASNSRNVTSQKRHPRLLQRVVTLLWLPQRRINIIHRRLKRRKLNHRIRDLPSPKRIQPLIQPRIPLLPRHNTPTLPQIIRKRRKCSLHAHFYSFKRAEKDVGDEFRGGGGAEVDDCFVSIGEEPLAVEIFEDFVETVFAGALEGVADEGGGPAEEDAAETFFGEDGSPGGDVGCVDFRVDLAATFYLDERDVSWQCWSRK